MRYQLGGMQGQSKQSSRVPWVAVMEHGDTAETEACRGLRKADGDVPA